MDLWSILPLLSGVMLLITGVVALAHVRPPRGRFLFFLAAATGALALLALARLQTEEGRTWGSSAEMIATFAIPVFCGIWAAFAFRFARARATGFWDVCIPVLCAFGAAAVLNWHLSSGGVTWSMVPGGGALLNLDTGPERTMSVLLLLVAAIGITRFQSLQEAARREGRTRLRRAALGPLLLSLGLFLFTSQALLYGGTSLHILAVAAVGIVPVCVLMLPLYAGLPPSESSLPEGTHLPVSSLVLMGLGSFLVALAVLGQTIHRYLPGRELIWFHWGGVILLLVFASLWLVPSLRDFLRRWFGPVPEARGDSRWEWARVNRALVPEETPGVLAAKLGSLVEDLMGRTAVALWLLDPSGERMIPVSESGTLPLLERDNPLRRVLTGEDSILDLSRPPARLSDLPPYVENQELIERLGFRLFVPLRVGGEELGILALAPRERALPADVEGLLSNLGAQLSNVVWGMRLAERVARTREGESFHRLGSFVLHDLKNAVGVLKGTVFNLREHIDDPRFREDMVSSLKATVDRMEAMLKRLRAGMLGEPVLARCEIEPLLERLARDLLPVAERSGVRLESATCAGVQVQSDPERLDTILHNLVRNAIEATPGGGCVHIEVQISPAERRNGSGPRVLEIRVRDQGTGADPQRIQQCFLRPTHSDKPAGWGIGLYQSWLLADSLGGSLRAEGGGQAGLCVTLSVPFEPVREIPAVRMA
jgi:putative PEP-CTERM system histidine kinase